MSNFINTKHLPSGLEMFVFSGTVSTAYYNGNPYPYFGFQTWKYEELGPLPYCLPLVKGIIRRSASWLFGKPVTFKFLGDEALDKELQAIWKNNQISRKLLKAAKMGGKEGGLAIKFAYDAESSPKVKIQFLSVNRQVRFYYDPHDQDNLQMVRISYPFQNQDDGKWYWYREEWTKELLVKYVPLAITGYGTSNVNPYVYVGSPVFPDVEKSDKWVIESTSANPFNVIPVQKVVNLDEDDIFGSGDVFYLWKAFDKINLAYFLMDKSNQRDVFPSMAFIDLEPKEGDGLDRPQPAGATLDLKSVDPTDDNPNPRQGRVELLQGNGAMREHLFKYADDIKQMVFDATGAVFPRQEHFTNKGSMTESVLKQMYAPLLEITEQKRVNYGENGLIPFIKTMVIGLANAKVLGFQKYAGLDIFDDKLDTSLTWFSTLPSTEDEKFAHFDRIDRAVKAGYLPSKIGIERVLEIEQLTLTDEQIEEQEKLVDERSEFEFTDPRSGNDPGGSEDGQSPTDSGGNKQTGNAKQGIGAGSRQQKRGKRVKDSN